MPALPISDARTCNRPCTYLRPQTLMCTCREKGLSRKTWGKEFHKRCHSPSFHRKRLRWRLQTFAGKVANVCGEKRQCTARTDAVHCGDGCSALRERLQCTASEMGKTGTEIASPILDKRTGRRDAPVAPWKYLLYLHLGISPTVL